MTKNKLLNIAIYICKCIKIFYIFLFIIITGFFIHFQVSPNSYKGATFDSKSFCLTISKSDSWKINNSDGTTKEDKEVFALTKLSKVSLYILYFQFSAVLIFIFLSTKEFQKIMESVKNLKTFQSNNVTSFRKIGKYLFIIFLLTSFTSAQFQQGGKSEIHLNFTPILFMLFAFIMAEIFKEGNLLQKENDLTI